MGSLQPNAVRVGSFVIGSAAAVAVAFLAGLVKVPKPDASIEAPVVATPKLAPRAVRAKPQVRPPPKNARPVPPPPPTDPIRAPASIEQGTPASAASDPPAPAATPPAPAPPAQTEPKVVAPLPAALMPARNAMHRLIDRTPPPAQSEWNEAARVVLDAAEALGRAESVLCVDRFLLSQRPDHQDLIRCWQRLEASFR